MKLLKLGILLPLLASSLVACSPAATEQPAADKETSAPSSTPAPAASSESSATASSTPAPVKPAPAKMVTVPAGTEIEIVLSNSLSSGKNQSGETFMATLAGPVVVDGTTVLKKGTMVHGHVVDAKDSGRVKGLASLSLTLTEVAQDDKMVSIETKNWVREAENTKKRDAGVIGAAAGIGAAIGAIAGGKKGAAEGAAIGGGAGTGTVLVTKGKEVELEPEAKISFTLEKSIQLAATKTPVK